MGYEQKTPDYSPERWLFDSVRRYLLDGIRSYTGHKNDYTRRKLLQLFLFQTEQLDIHNLAEVPALRDELLDIATYQPNEWCSNKENTLADKTTAEFAKFIDSVSQTTPDYSIEPLFARRVISKQRADHIRAAAQDRWQFPANREWFPFSSRTDKSLTWCSAHQFARFAQKREVTDLISNSGHGCFYWIDSILWQGGASGACYWYEASAADQLTIMLEHDDSERIGYWCDSSNEWIIYFTFDQTMTVGGKLAKFASGLEKPNETDCQWIGAVYS